MSPPLRKFTLTAHVACSVGWLGAVAGFLALAVASLTSHNAQMVRGVYLAMNLTGWFVIVPLSLASLVTGIVQSLGTEWGLFRHYWIVAKLSINLFCTVVLLIYMPKLERLAGIAANTALLTDGLLLARDPSPLLHAGLALLLLLAATTLSVYKPRGLTPYGRRKQLWDSTGSAGVKYTGRPSVGAPRWTVVGIIVSVLILIFLILHLSGGGFRGHNSN